MPQQHYISLTNDSLTVVFTDTPTGVLIHTINRTHPSWGVIMDLVDDPSKSAEILKLISVKEAIVKFTHGRITVVDNAVLYDGKAVNGFIVDRILEFLKNNLPYQSLVKFLDRVRLNPSARSVEELYKFLEHRNMPLTPTGTFLAYKSVGEDYMDHHSGTVRNQVGDAPARFERNQVDDDANRGCSYGYHVGSLEYASTFGGEGSHLMIVEVDPTDVVSVPYECDCQKLRCTGYKVVGEFKQVLDNNFNDEFQTDVVDYDDEEDNLDELEDDLDELEDDMDCDNCEEKCDCEETAYNLGYAHGYSAGRENTGFNNIDNDTYDIEELDELYREGYQKGYDNGVSDREL